MQRSDGGYSNLFEAHVKTYVLRLLSNPQRSTVTLEA